MSLASLYGVISAAGLIFVTTADDAVWLVPYLSPARFTRGAIFAHALSFIFTLQVLVWSLAIVCKLAHAGVASSSSFSDADDVAARVGCALAWIISFYFTGKAYQKAQRKRQALVLKQAAANAGAGTDTSGMRSTTYTPIPTNNAAAEERGQGGGGPSPDQAAPAAYGSMDVGRATEEDVLEASLGANADGGNDAAGGVAGAGGAQRRGVSCATISSCLWMTLVGSLDEVSYFPSLLLTHTYSVWQLSAGAFMACVAIVSAVTLARVFCAPWLQIFDRIPLYVVTLLFAVYMTAELLLDRGSRSHGAGA